MRYSFKRGSYSYTRFLWLISYILFLKIAATAIAGSPESAPFPVKFLIPHICTKGSELKNPRQEVISSFQPTLNWNRQGLNIEAGCNDWSADTDCYISGNVFVSGIYQLQPLNGEEKFKTCSRLFNVSAVTTTDKPSTTPVTKPSPTTITRLTTTLHLTSTTVVKTRAPTLPFTNTTERRTKWPIISTKPHEVNVTEKQTSAVKEAFPLYAKILIGVISLAVVCMLTIIVLLQCRRTTYKPTTGNQEQVGIPRPAENLDYMDRESTGTYAEIDLPIELEYDYVEHATVNHLNDDLDIHCLNSASNGYLTPIEETHNSKMENYEKTEHVESNEYEKLRQLRQAEPYNLYDTTREASYITPVEKLRRAGRAGNGAEGYCVDMALSSGNKYQDDYLKPIPSKKRI